MSTCASCEAGARRMALRKEHPGVRRRDERAGQRDRRDDGAPARAGRRPGEGRRQREQGRGDPVGFCDAAPETEGHERCGGQGARREQECPHGVGTGPPCGARGEDGENRHEGGQVHELAADERRGVAEREAGRGLRVDEAMPQHRPAGPCLERDDRDHDDGRLPRAPPRGRRCDREAARGSREVRGRERERQQPARDLRRRGDAGQQTRDREERAPPRCSARGSAARGPPRRCAPVHANARSRSGVIAKRPMAISGTTATTSAATRAPAPRRAAEPAGEGHPPGDERREDRRDDMGTRRDRRVAAGDGARRRGRPCRGDPGTRAAGAARTRRRAPPSRRSRRAPPRRAARRGGPRTRGRARSPLRRCRASGARPASSPQAATARIPRSGASMRATAAEGVRASPREASTSSHAPSSAPRASSVSPSTDAIFAAWTSRCRSSGNARRPSRTFGSATCSTERSARAASSVVRPTR